MKCKIITRDKKSHQISINANQFQLMCERGLGKAKLKSMIELNSGFFNNTYLIESSEGKHILRVAPHPSIYLNQYEQNLMKREYSIQPYLSPLSHLFPKTVFVDFTHQIIDRDYVFQEYLTGELWEKIKLTLSEDENNRIWYQLGETAKLISSVSSNHFGAPAPAKQFTQWGAYLIHHVKCMRSDLAKKGHYYKEVDEYIDKLLHYQYVLSPVKVARLVHGDLWSKNILIEKGPDFQYNISGILDSERAYWGDEISEWVHYFFDIPDAYWDGYGPLYCPDEAESRRKLYKGMHYVLAILEQKVRYQRDVTWLVGELGKINQEINNIDSAGMI